MRSTFTGRENNDGEFASSSAVNVAVKSAWFVEFGKVMFVPGSARTRDPQAPVISSLKNCFRYVRNTRMS